MFENRFCVYGLVKLVHKYVIFLGKAEFQKTADFVSLPLQIETEYDELLRFDKSLFTTLMDTEFPQRDVTQTRNFPLFS